MAEAFWQGHLGIMDYYRMKNIQAGSKFAQITRRLPLGISIASYTRSPGALS